MDTSSVWRFASIAGRLVSMARSTTVGTSVGCRRKDEFLAMLSHELRNPLAPLRNAVTLLQQADAEPEVRRRAREILDRQLAHLTRLVDDLLDIARITRGSIGLRRQPAPLGDIVSAAVETSRPLVDAGAHHLEVSLPAQPVTVQADPVRLAQVVSNLLNNAAKYTPPGGRIELEARVDSDGAAIAVRDNGPGIAAEDLARVFEMFRQGEETRRRSPGGLGVGLALARRLVEMQGGTIEARSQGAGQGAEFIVRLPVS